jgi:putative intracellular protease/amidase
VAGIGIYVFEDVEVMDFAAPYGVFSVARRFDPALDVFLVAEVLRPVQAQAGLTVVPNYSFAERPAMDAFLIPGGAGTRPETYNARLHDYVRSLPEETLLTSVCTGSWVYAQMGLLDGLQACGCRQPHRPSSGDEPVLVDESAKDVGSSDASGVGIGDRDRRFGDPRGAPLIEGSVGPMPVVVIHVFREDDLEMTAAEDEEPVQALPTDGADKPLGDRVRPGRADRGLDDLGVFGGEHLIEGSGELRVAVTDEEAERSPTLCEIADKVASDLGDERRGRMFADAEGVDGTAVDLDDD